MARKRRSGEIFSMSFLDCMSCGFGAVILFFMIINAQSKVPTDDQTKALQAETDRLEIEVLEGRKNLALARTSIQKLETEEEEASDQISIIKALIAELQAELAKYDEDTLANIQAIEKLQSDIKSLEEEVKRLMALKREQDALGQRVRSFKGEGDRQYLTGLKLGGERTLILVDRSSSMLHETIVNIIRRRGLPESEQLLSRKWRQVVASVDWLTSQFRADSQYQIYMFNNVTVPVIKGTEGLWLKADDGEQINDAINTLRRTVPKEGTNMYSAFQVIRDMNPRPDNVILLTDSMPTMDAATSTKSVILAGERLNLFTAAVQLIPSGIPVNIMLYPMEGDAQASVSFWALALKTRGSFISVSHDWP
ncbi:MAG: VWA domain-containing protein [Gammaproteobacteria bacterium]|nr:VWA domain-containing protein [Gammaproteobacteria bacterium]MDH5240524.1 VWA domain-containing protein [Gammaproteobacteria bacterium]MDH5259973.1 VWA domain-containing protein [Gammaproteobacteria bacterium]MDH5620506.1 VWA domain-containing protein [Gammaproteobacteria bacterium]